MMARVGRVCLTTRYVSRMITFRNYRLDDVQNRYAQFETGETLE